MRQSLEAIRPWILYIIHEYLKWFENITLIKTLCPGDDLPGQHPWLKADAFPDHCAGLRMEDFLSIAFVFDLHDLFWQASFAYVMTAPSR